MSPKSVALAALAAIMAFALCGCGSQTEKAQEDMVEEAVEATGTVRVGTMPTEDMLPMWVAVQEGLFEQQGVDVEIVSFDSAPALSAAITAGEVEMAMTDIMRAVKLCESGSPVDMEWVTLGTEASQGRFGVLASADAPYSTLEEMAEYFAANPADENAGVGVAANTVPEYVFDMLCEEAGVEDGAIPTTEVASLPERFSLAANGQIAGAALPNSLLVLGEANGMKLIAKDTAGDNVSQSVMVALSGWASGHKAEIETIAGCWDQAVDLIDASPEDYLELLVTNANINEAIAETYPVSEYPYAMEGGHLAHPDDAFVLPLLDWMKSKGYTSSDMSYDPDTGAFQEN